VKEEKGRGLVSTDELINRRRARGRKKRKEPSRNPPPSAKAEENRAKNREKRGNVWDAVRGGLYLTGWGESISKRKEWTALLRTSGRLTPIFRLEKESTEGVRAKKNRKKATRLEGKDKRKKPKRIIEGGTTTS